MKNFWLRRFAIISLVLFFVVIVAGSVVRTTGSGMGCPDWPTCFGYMVPPTDGEVLSFHPDHLYEKGQMIVHNDTLWVANAPFTSTLGFDRTQWHKYPKHDYAIFNPLQTWIEYINRLATAVFALPVLLMTFFGWRRMRREKDVITFLLCGGSLFLIGFEAWLGKLVVDGNLNTSSITLHMIGSLGIVMCILGILFRIRERGSEPGISTVTRWSLVLLVLSLTQIMLGTQVREETDVIAASGVERSLWIDQMSLLFPIHRSFSILIVGVVFMIWKKARTTQLSGFTNLLAGITAAEIFAGVILNYLGMPAFFQPLHLLFAIMMFSVCFYLILISRRGSFSGGG